MTLRKFSLLFVVLATVALAEPALRTYQKYSEGRGPGLALVVLKDGRVTRQETEGFSNLKEGTRISERTNFNLASNSKQFTAMMALILESRGTISENDLVKKYIPELPHSFSEIRLAHLIHHSSGLPDYMELCEASEPVTNAKVIEFLKTSDTLGFNPGDKFEYSNTGYVLLSEVVQRAAGIEFPALLEQEIFKPLEMNTTVVISLATEAKIQNRAIGYAEWPFFDVNDFSSCDYVYGDGGVYSNLVDYQKWLLALQTDKLVRGDYAKKLFASVTANDGKEIPYGYGWMNASFYGEQMTLHTGAWGGSRSLAAFFPNKGIWLALLSNYEHVKVEKRLGELAAPLLKP